MNEKELSYYQAGQRHRWAVSQNPLLNSEPKSSMGRCCAMMFEVQSDIWLQGIKAEFWCQIKAMRSQETLLLMSLHQDTLRGCLKLHPSTNITQFLISLRLTFPKETVETVARRLSSSPSVGGTDSRLLQHWQLRFGAVSCKLCSVVVMIVDWLLNRFLPWAAFQALTFMAGLCCGGG